MFKPRLLLHVCCAPCSTHPINMLSGEFEVIAFFYNPNIFPPEEHNFRLKESKDYAQSQNIEFISFPYQRTDWYQTAKPYSQEREGGERCRLCFEIRLRKTGEVAANMGIRYFSTTLTIGPNKPANVIFPLGKDIAKAHDLIFLEHDFKKQNGYKKSCELSKKASMYRQDYCGCEYSLRDRNIRRSLKQI